MKLLKKEMKILGYRNKELAARIGVSKTTIYKWTRGDFLPSPENIGRLRGLGFSDTACLCPSKDVVV